MSNQTDYNALLKNRKLKSTETRLKLLKAIDCFSGAIPFSTIQEELKGTDRITLYRTVQSFLEKGIIHKAHTDSNDIYYALCGNSCSHTEHIHNHIHFLCTTCEKVTCETLSEKITFQLPAFQINSAQINLTGICKSCLNN